MNSSELYASDGCDLLEMEIHSRLEVKGMSAISEKYKSLGGEGGYLGAARTPEGTCADGTGKYQHFNGGCIMWHPKTGAFAVRGSILARWGILKYELGPLGYPISDEEPNGSGFISRFQYGTIAYANPVMANFTVFFENMAFMPGDLYKGLERGKARDALVARLRNVRPAIVGLCEMFDNDIRDDVRSKLKDIYPYSLHGPDDKLVAEDGGLLFLSKYPFLTYAKKIYVADAAEDALTQKGVLHIRVQPPGLPTPVDLFLTHTQNPGADYTALDGDDPKLALEHQLAECGSFVQSQRLAGAPAILMGDINRNLNDQKLFQNVMEKFGWPRDIWLQTGDKTRWPYGITDERGVKEHHGFALVPPNDPARHKVGLRLDALFCYNGTGVWPSFRATEVVVEQSSPGRDMSDHYGLQTTMFAYEHLTTTITRSIKKVTVKLESFHCLRVSGLDSSSDECIFGLRCTVPNGKTWAKNSSRVDGITEGQRRSLPSPPTIEISGSDAGSGVDIKIRGTEWDPVGEDDNLGTSNITVSTRELQELIGRSEQRAMPRITEDNSEYVIFVSISVE
jgi:hypothetical protein